jgi:formamidase
MPDLYYAAACQTDFDSPTDRSQIAERVDHMIRMIEATVIGYEPFHDVRLFAFPEFAHTPPVYQTVAELRSKLAVELPNEHTHRYEQICAKYGIYLQTGTFLEMDPAYPDVVFNTTLLIGPAGILSKYRKVNPWIPWEVHASPTDIAGYADELFPVVDTELGKLGVAICYDWLFPEAIRQIAFNGAEVILRVSAYMDPWGTQQPMDWWTLINRTRAIENTTFVVASNQGAQFKHYPPFSWPGGSMVVDYDGRILAQADPGPGEKIVVAPIAIDTLRAERERRRGHDMRAHLRAGAHPYAADQYLEPAHARPDGHPITIQDLDARIADAKRRFTEED